MPITVSYDRGTRSARELQNIVDSLLESVPSDGDLADDIRRRGINPAEVIPGAITIEADGSGLDPVMVGLIVTFAGTPVLDIWRHVLLPRIKRRWGIRAVGQESDENGSR